MLIIFFSYFSTHNLNRVHFTLCILVSGKDHAEELCDVEVESMYPLVVLAVHNSSIGDLVTH